MPKVKTKKAAAKRMKITRSGKIMRGHQMANHLKSKKSKQALRRYRKYRALTSVDRKRIRRLLPNA